VAQKRRSYRSHANIVPAELDIPFAPLSSVATKATDVFADAAANASAAAFRWAVLLS
jgi:hypothetical protein